jgi:H+/Cl- antiporter ClcA
MAQVEAPWANSRYFLVDILSLGVLAGIMGVVSYAYGYIVGDLLSKWLTWACDGKDYPDEYLKDGGLGCPWWILLCWLGGTVVGLLKVAVGLDSYSPFIVEIRSQHCDTLPGLKTCLCCVVTLFSGACMGPEAGLASLGGGIGTFFATCVARLGPDWAEEADERRRLYVLGGICAAFGTIMPSPWVALLICVECSMLKDDADGKQLKLFGRRTLFILGYVAIVAWSVRYAVKEIPLLPDLAGDLRRNGDKYSNDMLPKAALLGVIGAMAALVYAIIGAIVKKVFDKIGARIERCLGSSARIMSMCSLAGLLTGVLGYLCPMSLASGKEAMFPMILSRLGTSPLFPTPEGSAWSLLWIVVAKTLSFSVASAGGMVGGPFFPVLFIGVVIGQLCAMIPIHWSVHPTALTVPVVMVSMPSSVFPIPFTLVAIPLSYFHLGTNGCVPILVSIVTSYTLVVGSGLIKALARG